MERTHPWELSDTLWARAEPLVPAAKPHPKGGRPPRSDREMLGAILYVLRTGLQWNALPRSIGASTTVYDRFRAWERDGFFARLWQAGLAEYDELVGIDWEWLSLDGVMTKAPFGGAATGRNPTDRGKRGTKRSLLTDGTGIPLALVVEGANRHDMKLLDATLDAVLVVRPEPSPDAPQHLCLDAGYDYPASRQAVEDHRYLPHIRSRGQEQQDKVLIPGHRARRWVVERTHSWLNRSRRLLVRWEKKVENYLAFLHLACAQLIFQKILVFG